MVKYRQSEPRNDCCIVKYMSLTLLLYLFIIPLHMGTVCLENKQNINKEVIGGKICRRKVYE